MKRPLAHRLFSVWLALLVLTASVGLTVQQHVCRMSGQRTAQVVFAAPHHGCPAPMQGTARPVAGKAQVKAPCCDFKAHLHKLTIPVTQQLWSKVVVPVLAIAFLPPSWPTAPSIAFTQQTTAWHASDSSPPAPRAGRALLTFVCTLLV